jgi:hypothetical protein
MVCAPLLPSMYFCNILRRYGASGDDAEKFEAAAATLFPQLMMMQPDLLCNLVTQIHPQDLVKHGCRIVRFFLPPPPCCTSLRHAPAGPTRAASRRIRRHIPPSVRAWSLMLPFLGIKL